MFFKREKTKVLDFNAQMDNLRLLGYQTESLPGGTRAQKGNLAAILREGQGGQVLIDAVGLAIGAEVAVLTDLGYQKIFLSPSGKKLAAVADHLKALHAFGEDLREDLGLTSLYNQGLGTTNEKHLYDRVEHRDSAHARHPWQKN
jgi:hypothetical protein